MTVGLFDKTGAAVAIHGAELDKISTVPQLPAYAGVAADAEHLFSAMLGDSLEVVKISQANSSGVRLVAIHPLDLGPKSFFRQILGTRSPAALVREGAVIENAKINDQNIGDEPFQARQGARQGRPAVGASHVFRVGEGLGARIGAVGRVPGPAGTGDNGTLLVVLSDKTAAAGQKELCPPSSEAKDNGMTGEHWSPRHLRARPQPRARHLPAHHGGHRPAQAPHRRVQRDAQRHPAAALLRHLRQRPGRRARQGRPPVPRGPAHQPPGRRGRRRGRRQARVAPPPRRQPDPLQPPRPARPEDRRTAAPQSSPAPRAEAPTRRRRPHPPHAAVRRSSRAAAAPASSRCRRPSRCAPARPSSAT
jgi:hypothetical protein